MSLPSRLPSPATDDGPGEPSTEKAPAVADLIPRSFATCPGNTGGAHGLVVMQFNVLADGPAQSQFADRVEHPVLAFPHRFNAALCEVSRVAPDILCMQEVNHYHDFWEERLRDLGFEVFFVPKWDPGYPSEFRTPPEWYQGQPTDGCALCVKRGRLRLGRHVAKRFSELTGDPSMSQVVASAEILDDVTGKQLLTVSLSHLKAGGGEANAEVRRVQGQVWVKHLQEFAGNLPLVITGDMNEDMRRAKAGAVSCLCDGLILSSAYALGQGDDPPYTAIDGSWRRCYDYILVSAGVRPLRLWTVPDLPHNAIPSRRYPSDHLAIAAELLIL